MRLKVYNAHGCRVANARGGSCDRVYPIRQTRVDIPNVTVVTYVFSSKSIIKHEITESRHGVSKSLNSCRLFVSPSIKLSPPKCIAIEMVIAGVRRFVHPKIFRPTINVVDLSSFHYPETVHPQLSPLRMGITCRIRAPMTGCRQSII